MVTVVLAESVTGLGLVFLTLLFVLAGTLEDRFCLNGFSPPPPG